MSPETQHPPPTPELRSQRFTWPPQTPPTQPLPAGEPHSPHHAQLDASTRAQRAGSTPRSLLSAWEHIESTWLGLTTPPLRRRLAEATASPDPLHAFCWRCARTVGPFETDAKGCSHCRGTRPPWDRTVRLAQYIEPWRSIVHDAKFTAWPTLAQDLGRMLGAQLMPILHADAHVPTIVVPVPTATSRRLARGTDHALNIARGVARELHLPLRTLLARQPRPEQNRLSRTQRLTNLTGSMSRSWIDRLVAPAGITAAYRWPFYQPGSTAADPGTARFSARMILVDDISTTGATLAEAAKSARSVCKCLEIKRLEIVSAIVCKVEPRPARPNPSSL